MGDWNGIKDGAELLEKLGLLTEDQKYDVFAETFAGKHRKTFLKIKPRIEEREAPPGPIAPPDPSRLTAPDLEAAALEERPLPPGLAGYMRLGEPSGPTRPYRVFEAPQEAVLRPLNQVLYDKLIVPESGRVGRVNLFTDSKWFPDHTRKTEKDTNMTCDGFLGSPLRYSLKWIDLKFEKFANPDDLKRVLRGLTFRWIRGQDTPWLKVTLSGFQPYMDLTGVNSDVAKEFCARELKKYEEAGAWTRYRISVLTEEGQPQEIDSTESFRVEVSDNENGLGELHGPVHLKVLLGDTLLTCL